MSYSDDITNEMAALEQTLTRAATSVRDERRKAPKIQDDSSSAELPRASTPLDQKIAREKPKKPALSDDNDQGELKLEDVGKRSSAPAVRGSNINRRRGSYSELGWGEKTMGVPTRFQIREDVELFDRACRGLDEMYLKPEDPSMAVMTFMEKVASHMGAIKSAYAHSSGERNQLPEMIRPHVREIRAATVELETMLNALNAPEDTNRSIPPGG